jgi:hypothetical protein
MRRPAYLMKNGIPTIKVESSENGMGITIISLIGIRTD